MLVVLNMKENEITVECAYFRCHTGLPLSEMNHLYISDITNYFPVILSIWDHYLTLTSIFKLTEDIKREIVLPMFPIC
jgi:hypothetical protein